MKTILIESHYLPCIAYFSAIFDADELVVEKYEHYQKQSYRNRCYIKGPHRTEILIVPVTGKTGRTPICDVRIDYGQKWLNNHWRTIRTAYGNAPYFEHYASDLHDVLFKKPHFLYDLNLTLLELCLKWLKVAPVIQESTVYAQADPAVTDLRGTIDPKRPEGCNKFYQTKEYQQVFGSMFVPNLSLVDLVFNRGPGARGIVNASRRNEQ